MSGQRRQRSEVTRRMRPKRANADRAPVGAKVEPENRDWLYATALAADVSASSLIDDMITAAREGRIFSPPVPGVLGQSRDAAAQSGNVGSRTRQTEEE